MIKRIKKLGRVAFARVSYGFTLLELLVSMAVFLVLMAMLFSILDQGQRIWLSSGDRIGAFREARIAFESLTSTMGKANLNPYWDYDNPNDPKNYVRKSELRFVSGPGLLPGDNRATHSVFFQAPLGVSSGSTFQGMETVFSSCGYFLEHGDNTAQRPAFLNGIVEPKTRFRLMQWIEPGEQWQLFTHTSGEPGYNGHDWFTTPVASGTNAHVLAENVIALVILPKLPSAEDSSGTALAPDYQYDSSPARWPPSFPQERTENQLPPVVQISMVTLDDASADRLEEISGGNPISYLGLNTLFQNAGQLEQDLESLKTALTNNRLRYHVFQSSIKIKGAKWSRP